jgi:ketosteroid isomerase-like protein
MWRGCLVMTLCLIGQAGAQDVVGTPTLEAAVAQSHRALTAILNGDPKGYEALFADREDITLGNPFGPFASGRAAVVKTLAGAAAKYREGSASVNLVAKYADDKLACVVEVENDRAKVGTSDVFAEFHVRVTSLYEKIGGDWQLVHRHADPISMPRPAESVLGK